MRDSFYWPPGAVPGSRRTPDRIAQSSTRVSNVVANCGVGRGLREPVAERFEASALPRVGGPDQEIADLRRGRLVGADEPNQLARADEIHRQGHGIGNGAEQPSAGDVVF